MAIAIDSTLGVDLGDRDIWARQITRAKKKLKKQTPAAVDLETAITNIRIADTFRGSSTIELTIADPGWELLDMGFFDVDRDGDLDIIDVNYPENGRFWWRLQQVNVNTNRAGAQITMTFMERVAVQLMHKRGPVKVSRAKRTRAEAMKMLTEDIKSGGRIIFHSRELHKKQPIEKPETERRRKEDKIGGINSSEEIEFKFWDGTTVKLQPNELQNAETALDEAFQHTDKERPLLALNMACIVEAPMFRNPKSGDSSSVGILQLLDIHGSVELRRDIAWVVDKFLNVGFTGAGGAIALAREHPDWSPGAIAQAVQGSAHPDRYDKVRDCAEQVLQAYGGTLTAETYRKQYNFEIGTPDEPHESYWDGMNRWADEVNWPLFLDGQHMYFDSEMTLIKQKPVAVIKRNDPAVIGLDVTWDARQVATEATLALLCDPFEFRAGEVFKLQGFGPASTGSTAKLPGRWLIQDIERDRFQLFSTFTLKQPEKPKKEPAPEIGERKHLGAAGGGSIEGSPKDVIDNVVLPIAREAGIDITAKQVEEANARHGPTTSGSRSDHQGPPDEAWAADMSNGASPTREMDKLAAALAERFNLSWNGAGAVSGTVEGSDSQEILGADVKATYRVQLIYRSNVGGNHFNHVHFGIRRII